MTPPGDGQPPASGVEPESSPRIDRRTRREEFDRFVAQEYPGLLAEITILLDDRRRAVRRLRRALVGTWRDWDRERTGPDPAGTVRELVLAKVDLNARPDSRHADDADRPLTLTALAGLPSVQRQALVLHHVLGRTVEQVALDTGSSVPTVRQRLCHGAWALASRHPHAGAAPLPRAAPRPRPEARTRVLTDVLDGWAATELEVLRETMRRELAAEQTRPAGAGIRNHDRRRLAMTAAAAAVGAAGAVALVAASVHALEHASTTPSAPASSQPAAAPDGAPAAPGPAGRGPVTNGPVSGGPVSSGPVSSGPDRPQAGQPANGVPSNRPADGPVPIAPQAGTGSPAPSTGIPAAGAPVDGPPVTASAPAAAGDDSGSHSARPASPRATEPDAATPPAPAVPRFPAPWPYIPHPPAHVPH